MKKGLRSIGLVGWLGASLLVVVAITGIPASAVAESEGERDEASAEESATERTDRDTPSRRASPWVRRLAEFGGGVGGFYTGAVAGAGIGIGVAYLRGETYPDVVEPDVFTAISVVSGATFAAPAGTALLGSSFDAKGRYMGALSGGLIGSIAGLWVTSNFEGTDRLGIAVPIWAVSTALGSTVSYEVTHARRSSWARIRPAPVATMTPGARSFGLSIDF